MCAESLQNDDRPANWIPLEDRLYRRDVQYSTLPWSLTSQDIATSVIAVAPNAGPIAVVSNAGWGVSPTLRIYSVSGNIIRQLDRLRERTNVPLRVVAMGWTASDSLTIIYSDAHILRLSPSLRLSDAKSIVIDPADEQRIYDAVVSSNGLVTARAMSGNIYQIDPNDNVTQEKVTVKPRQSLSRDMPKCEIGIAIPDSASHALPQTVLVAENGKIVLVNSDGAQFMPWNSDVAQICLSPNGQYIASMENESGVISVYTLDLKTEIAQVDLSIELAVIGVENKISDDIFNATTPQDIAWVGSNAIAVVYKEHLVLIGPHGGVSVISLDANGNVLACTEKDGLRIISSTRVEFIQIVSDAVASVLSQKETPGNKLMRCSGEFPSAAKDQPANALTRYGLLKELQQSSGLVEATRSCVAAAYLEVDTSLRKRMLNAATYGLRYANVFAKGGKNSKSVSNAATQTVSKQKNHERNRRDVNMVPTAIAIFRVMNAVSSADVGIPLTKSQFDNLGLAMLVGRVARYGLHTLAIRLATFGGISPSQVFSEWATAVLHGNGNETDDNIANMIIERFESFRRSYNASGPQGNNGKLRLPYFKAAEAAHAIGRSKCAELLLRKETRPAPKVAMYLKMGREAPAVVASVASGDPELVLDALGTILEKKSVRETARLLRTLPPALSHRAADLFSTHLKQIGDINSLKWVYLELGRRREAAVVDIYKADQHEDSVERLEELEKAALGLGRGHSRRICDFEIQTLQHASAVASCAIEVEKRGRLAPGTLRYANDGDLLARAILEIGDSNKRQDMLLRLRREVRVPDRRFFWVCLNSMGEGGDFESIEQLSNSGGFGKAPPIGLSAFVDICIKYGRDEEGVKYAVRIADLRERARALARCGRGREAADLASRLRNQQLLEEVQALAARHVTRIVVAGSLKD